MHEPTKKVLLLTKQLVEISEKYEKVSKEKAALYNTKKSLEAELSDKMKELDLENFRSSEFGLISRSQRFWAKITDMSLAQNWLEENGLAEEVLKLEPVNSRLNEIMKKRLEEGLAIPQGFDYSLSKGISIRAA
jgi:hypothetical protein